MLLRFFYMNAGLWGSPDGAQWSALSHDDTYVFLGEIAYGNGVYLGVGNGMQLSSDGSEWHDASLDCATLPINCLTDPQFGNGYPNTVDGVFFAEGRFHIRGYPTEDPSWALTKSEGELTSTDGVSWQFVAGPVPDAYVAGHFTEFVPPWRAAADAPLAPPAVWFDGDSTPRPIDVSRLPALPIPAYPDALPADVDLSWGDGVDCTNARCVLIHSQLYWVP